MEDNKVLGALLRGDYGDMSKSAAEEVMSKWVPIVSACCIICFAAEG